LASALTGFFGGDALTPLRRRSSSHETRDELVSRD